jgi:hypothetical protein
MYNVNGRSHDRFSDLRFRSEGRLPPLVGGAAGHMTGFYTCALGRGCAFPALRRAGQLVVH